ncbi:MAG TPA: CrcB family protein [Pilimelia sp.]|nr:CrcB family protein [Pilimelia sp.]
MTLLAIAAAGALGAVARYGVGVLAGPSGWPWPTLAINVAGSFLAGLLVEYGAVRLPATLATAVTVGFLGAFTTYSAFSVQTVALLRAGRGGAALGYVLLTLVLGLAAAAAGVRLAQLALGGGR